MIDRRLQRKKLKVITMRMFRMLLKLEKMNHKSQLTSFRPSPYSLVCVNFLGYVVILNLKGYHSPYHNLDYSVNLRLLADHEFC